MMPGKKRQRVIIVGGGFGGLNAAKALRRADIEVVVVDKRNFHLFQPLLYQVATGGLSPANIAAPIRVLLKRQKNARVVLGEVVSVDANSQTIEIHRFDPGEQNVQVENLPFDWLILAAGATNSYFNHDDWEQFAPGLKTIEDATEIRARIFSAFEAAENEPDIKRRGELMKFVVVGGGPTGVEMAGAIAELARKTLKSDFRNINPADAKIVLVDGQDRMLASFPPMLSTKAEKSLRRLGIEILVNTFVTALDENSVELKSENRTFTIQSRTILWAAGVAAVPIGTTLAETIGAEVDRAGRLYVNERLSITGHANIFAIGDLASCTDQGGKPLPGVAPVAIQQGKYVGQLIASQLRGKSHIKAFRYRDRGNLATIGRSAAVADLGRMKFGGVFAWLLWLLIHIMSITQFQNRVLVLFQWAWNYITFNRSARLITNTYRFDKDENDTCQDRREKQIRE